METYIWKLILCSAAFIAIYFLIFEKQKNHRFKRFYLLGSIVFSLMIPLTAITYGVQEVQNQMIIPDETGTVDFTGYVTEPSAFTTENILAGIYALITLFLLIRFGVNLSKLIRETRTGQRIPFGNHFLILKNQKTHPYSFWKYIFLNKSDFENQQIDEKILIHEKAHLDQKHSLDILFTELLLAVFWFNPSFYLYRKAIITNHEFLADEAVLAQENHITNYQKLLLSELISERILFTQPFNLSNTKKRIKMMTTPKNRTGKYLSWLTLPLSAFLFFMFTEKIPAKNTTPEKTVVADNSIPSLDKEEAKTPSKQEITLSDTIRKPTVEDMRKVEKQVEEARKNLEEAQKKLQKSETELQKIREVIPPPPPPAPASGGSLEAENHADQTPEFPGGLNAFRNKVGMTLNTAIFKGDEGLLKSDVDYLINENGKLEIVTVKGDNPKFNGEITRTLKQISNETEWKPAMKDGKPVRYRLRLPLTMKFENNTGNSK